MTLSKTISRSSRKKNSVPASCRFVLFRAASIDIPVAYPAKKLFDPTYDCPQKPERASKKPPASADSRLDDGSKIKIPHSRANCYHWQLVCRPVRQNDSANNNSSTHSSSNTQKGACRTYIIVAVSRLCLDCLSEIPAKPCSPDT